MQDSFINPFDAVVNQPLLILTPRRWIFRRLGRILVLLFMAAFFSYNVFFYISIPIYMMSFYFVYELSAPWRAHRYSTAVLYTLVMLNLLIFLMAGNFLRKGFYALFTLIF